jgi:hypothetical protein
MDIEETEVKNECVDEGQQQFNRPQPRQESELKLQREIVKH